jgi:hypothetical protein
MKRKLTRKQAENLKTSLKRLQKRAPQSLVSIVLQHKSQRALFKAWSGDSTIDAKVRHKLSPPWSLSLNDDCVEIPFMLSYALELPIYF